MSFAMRRENEIFAVSPAPATFDSLDKANTLHASHGHSNLVIARGRWALAVGDTVYAFASDAFNLTISAAVAADSALTDPPEQSNGHPRSHIKRDHPFSWGPNFGLPRCSAGHPCEEDADCAPFNCELCMEEVGKPNPRSYCFDDD